MPVSSPRSQLPTATWTEENQRINKCASLAAARASVTGVCPASPGTPAALLPWAAVRFRDPAGKTGTKILLHFNYTSKPLAVSRPSEIVLIEVP